MRRYLIRQYEEEFEGTRLHTRVRLRTRPGGPNPTDFANVWLTHPDAVPKYSSRPVV